MLGSFGVSHGVQAILFANLHDDNARFALCSQSLFCSHRLLREELWSERLRLWRWCRHSTDELTRLTFLSHMSSNLLCTFEFCLRACTTIVNSDAFNIATVDFVFAQENTSFNQVYMTTKFRFEQFLGRLVVIILFLASMCRSEAR